MGNSVVALDQVIYILGHIQDVELEVGPDKKHFIDSWFCSYHPSTKNWELENNGKLPNNLKGTHSAAAIVKDCILLVGGRDTKADDRRDPSTYQWESLKSAHLYSTITKEWQQVKDMSVSNFTL